MQVTEVSEKIRNYIFLNTVKINVLVLVLVLQHGKEDHV